MIRYLFSLGILFLLFAACSSRKTIVHPRDYEQYMQPGLVTVEVKKTEKEIEFWQQKLATDTGSYVYMLELASNYLHLFRVNGEVGNLQRGDSLLKRSSAKIRDIDPAILYSLSQTAISQHQFLSAASYAEAATNAKGDAYTICLLQFDANMELGRYHEAYNNLQRLKDKNAFDYLIRKAKWEDHKGNLDGAIVLMEQAFEKVKNGKKNLYCWALSNLGDMYGHAGRIEEAYNAYLDVLKKDPANLYCLKGIAWIAYAHDKDTKESKRILQYILSQTMMPDLKLTLAEIAATEGREEERKKWIQEFVSTVTAPGYDDMYNKYLLEIYTDESREYEKAFAIAEKELKSRFTPETCDWMAWVYYNKGDTGKAIEFSRHYVYNKTFEPGASMHTAFIFAAAGMKKEAKKLLEECLESSFELGPSATRQIEEKLRSL